MPKANLQRSRGAILAAGVLLTLALACGSEEKAPGAGVPPEAAPTPAAADPVPAVSEAQQLFELRCVTCHGAEGRGDGPGSTGLTPAPRDFGDPAWQDEVSDEHIANIVLYGGAAVGRSPTMPGNPDLTAKPDVVKALVAQIRNLRTD